MNDLYSALKQHEKAQETNRPTKGVVKSVDGDRVNVLVRGSSTVLRSVKAVGAVTVAGQEVVLSWEKGVPTAHVVGGMAEPQNLVAFSRGPQGPQGEIGPEGPQGPAGSLSAASSLGLTELSSTPSPPSPGTLLVYAKDDGKVYKQNSSGVEEEVGTGVTDHNDLLNIGANSHATIDAHLANSAKHSQAFLFHTYGGPNKIPGGTTYYMYPGLTGFATSFGGGYMPKPGTVKRLFVRLNSSQPSTGEMTVKVYVNAVETDLAASIPKSATADFYIDFTHEAHFNAQEFITIYFANSATSDSGIITSVAFDVEWD